MVGEGYDPVILVELQTSLRALEVEVVGRYLSQPSNLNKIRLALAETFDRLVELKVTAELGGGDCPGGWVHRPSCSCIPMTSAAALADGDSDIKKSRDAKIEEWKS